MKTLIKAGAMLALIAGLGLATAMAADNACKSCQGCSKSCSSCAKCSDGKCSSCCK
jgi:predicted secreted protein